VIKRINEHNHSGNGTRVEVLSARNEIKERSTTTEETAAKGEISKLTSLKKLSQRQRQLAGLAPPAPNILHI